MYPTGSSSIIAGRTIFLLEGNIKHVNYTDKFLQENGSAPGLTVLMTPAAFMTKDAWIAETPPVTRGLRSSDPIV